MQEQPPKQEQQPLPSLQRIKRECAAMMKLLTKLEQEEIDLRSQNDILARTALLSGFSPALLEPPEPKRRRRGQSKAEDSKDDKS